MFIFYALLPYISFPFFRTVKFCSGCFRQVFFHLGDKKKWSQVVLDRVVILYSKNCMEICLGRLSVGCLRQVVVL